MALTASRNSSEFSLAPEGTHIARCRQLIDLGTQYSAFYKKSSPKILIGWELPNEMDGDKPHMVYKRYTRSLSEKSKLFGDLKAWRGRAFTDAELECFQLTQIVNAPCMLTVIHNEREGSTYADVASVSGIPKGSKCPDAITPAVMYDIDDHDQVVFDTFSENLQKTINNAAERSDPKKTAAIEATHSDEDTMDEEVPF